MTDINNNKDHFKMEPSTETKEYFKNVSRKMDEYHKNISFVKKYVAKKRISDTGKISNMVIMAVVWTSFLLDEFLTETDVLVILGSNQILNDTTIMHLDPELSNLSLTQLMEAVSKAYDEKKK